MTKIKVKNPDENRGRKTLAPQDKRKALTVFIPLKNHAKFKRDIEPLVKKYL